MSFRRPLRIHRRLARLDRSAVAESSRTVARQARRFRAAPDQTVAGREVPVAVGFRARLLGLALLDRAGAGPGLLIPRCAAVHTFGMRFPLDVYLLGREGEILAVHRGVPPRRFVSRRGAAAVLELPA